MSWRPFDHDVDLWEACNPNHPLPTTSNLASFAARLPELWDLGDDHPPRKRRTDAAGVPDFDADYVLAAWRAAGGSEIDLAAMWRAAYTLYLKRRTAPTEISATPLAPGERPDRHVAWALWRGINPEAPIGLVDADRLTSLLLDLADRGAGDQPSVEAVLRALITLPPAAREVAWRGVFAIAPGAAAQAAIGAFIAVLALYIAQRRTLTTPYRTPDGADHRSVIDRIRLRRNG